MAHYLTRDNLPSDVAQAVDKILEIVKPLPSRPRISVERVGLAKGRYMINVELGHDLIDDDELVDSILHVIDYTHLNVIEICPMASMWPMPAHVITH